MTYSCRAVRKTERPALTIRARSSVEELPSLLGEGYGKIAAYMQELGTRPAGPPFVTYYNMDMQDLDVEFGFPLLSSVEGRGDMQATAIPAARVATCVHVGPYSSVGQAYEALQEWIAEHGHEVTGVAYEFYLNDPQDTPAEELQTVIEMPLKAN